MSTTTPNPDHHFAPTVARAIVRVWPHESREWGRAFAAELPTAASAGAAISWLIGGFMFLSRMAKARMAWLGGPIASSSGNESTAAFAPRYSRNPRTPLWLMLALTICSVAILLHPEVRSSTRKTPLCIHRSHLLGLRGLAQLKKLRAISNSNRDPSFSHCLHSSPPITKNASHFRTSHQKRSIPDLARLRGLAKNLAATRPTRLFPERTRRTASEMGFTKFRALPHGCRTTRSARGVGSVRRHRSRQITYSRRDKASRHQSRFNSEMHAAFTAPRYDNYTTKALELTRSVCEDSPFTIPKSFST